MKTRTRTLRITSWMKTHLVRSRLRRDPMRYLTRRQMTKIVRAMTSNYVSAVCLLVHPTFHASAWSWDCRFGTFAVNLPTATFWHCLEMGLYTHHSSP